MAESSGSPGPTDRPPSKRSYTERVLKKLFALSHNVCAFRGCDQKLADPAWPGVQAEICHIYGLRPTSARYVQSMSDAERNDYDNLILLCPNHHRVVDDLEPAAWRAERLLELKLTHEHQRAGDVPVHDEIVNHAVLFLVVSGIVEVDELTVVDGGTFD